MKLTAKKIAKLVRRCVKGKHPDGHGLYLQIQNRNNASWFFRYERDGTEHFPGIGPIHTVGLKEARERAQALRLQLLDGVDPIAAKGRQSSARIRRRQGHQLQRCGARLSRAARRQMAQRPARRPMDEFADRICRSDHRQLASR